MKTYNVIGLIKSKLKEGISNTNKGYSQSCSDLFKSWKAANFAIDHEFLVQNDGKNSDARKLLDIAINSEYLNVAEALVRDGADIKPKKMDLPIYVQLFLYHLQTFLRLSWREK